MVATLAELAIKLSMTGMNLTKGVTTPLTLKPAHEVNDDVFYTRQELQPTSGISDRAWEEWQKKGVIPYGERKWHNGKPASIYTPRQKSAIDMAVALRKNGFTLAQIAIVTRCLMEMPA